MVDFAYNSFKGLLLKDVLARGGTTELTATGYSRGSLANDSVSVDDTNDLAAYDADDLVFSSVAGDDAPVVAAVVFHFVTSDALSTPMIFIEIAVTPNGSDLTIAWDSTGILHVT